MRARKVLSIVAFAFAGYNMTGAIGMVVLELLVDDYAGYKFAILEKHNPHLIPMTVATFAVALALLLMFPEVSGCVRKVIKTEEEMYGDLITILIIGIMFVISICLLLEYVG